MVSIRRTLSPVPHPGNLVNGEASSISSPLSKSSSCNQDNSPSGGLASSSSYDHGIYKVQSFLSGIFSQRPLSRSLERPKVKGQGWRRSVFHILICFCIGIFVGVTPFLSMNMSMNSMSEEQEFPFKKFPLASENVTSMEIEDKLVIRNDSVPLEPQVTNGDIENGTSDGTVVFESVYQDSLKIVVDQDSFEVFHKLLIIVTPTYTRPFQAYYLNRLAYTLKLVPPPLLWIVVEMNSQSLETANMLRRTGVMYRHLVCSKNLTGLKYMSVHQRNVALSHIENHRLDGIVYFADDANIYSTELFEQMRQIRRFGTWTVAKLVPSLSQTALEGPICNGTRVLGWHSNDVRRRFRRFHVQMSGFAFNSTILWDPKRWHRPTLEPIRQLDTVKEEVQVSTFVEQVVEDEGQMEGLPLDCSKVMVWQVRIESPTLHSYPPEWRLKNNLDVIFPHISEF